MRLLYKCQFFWYYVEQLHCLCDQVFVYASLIFMKIENGKLAPNGNQIVAARLLANSIRGVNILKDVKESP